MNVNIAGKNFLKLDMIDKIKTALGWYFGLCSFLIGLTALMDAKVSNDGLQVDGGNFYRRQ